MTKDKIRVCGGILLVRSESGRSKLEKVLVEAKPGKTKNRVKCRFKRFVPSLIRKHGKCVISKSEHSALTNSARIDILPSLNGDFRKISEDAYGKNLDKVSKLSATNSQTNTIFENGSKPKDSTLHISYFDDDFEADEDDFVVEPPTKNAKKINPLSQNPTVMAHVSTTLLKPYEEPEDTDYDSDDTSYELDTQEHSRYIDSGLRRLRSEESRLYIFPVLYKTKRRHPPATYDDGIKPILAEITSDIFEDSKLPQKKTSEEIADASADQDVRTDESLTDVSGSRSDTSEIDTKPLATLKDLEDTTFTISTTGFGPSEPAIPKIVPPGVGEDKDDFCVHTKEPWEDVDFSRSDVKQRKKKQKSSIFGFFRKKDDFCVHTPDSSGLDYSTTAFKRKKKDICVHLEDPSGKSDYSSSGLGEKAKDFCVHTAEIDENQKGGNLASSTILDRRKKSFNRLSRGSNVASTSVFDDVKKKSSKILQENRNLLSATEFDRKKTSKKQSERSRSSKQFRSNSKSKIHQDRSISTVSVLNTKEARRSKYSKMKLKK